VLDFGLAKQTQFPQATATSSSADRGRQVVGTVAYMSPEQARDGIVDARTALFSVGAVLYELATGRPAFSHAGREVAEERGAWCRRHMVDVAVQGLDDAARSHGSVATAFADTQ